MAGFPPAGSLAAAATVGGISAMTPAAMLGPRLSTSLAAATLMGLGALPTAPALPAGLGSPLPAALVPAASRRLATVAAAAMLPARPLAIPTILPRARMAPAGVPFAPPVPTLIPIGPRRGRQQDQRRADGQASQQSRPLPHESHGFPPLAVDLVEEHARRLLHDLSASRGMPQPRISSVFAALRSDKPLY